MDPLHDLVRDRTQDLRRTADVARRERELRGTPTEAPDHRSNARSAATLDVDGCAGPCLPIERARVI